MVNIIVGLSKYLMIILAAVYTFSCFSVFAEHNLAAKRKVLRGQNCLMFFIQFIAYMVMYLQTQKITLLFFYLAQVILLGAIILLYVQIYPKSSRLVVNNMCMLLCIGFIMITRLNYEKAIKQFIFVALAVAISLVVPVIIRKVKFLPKWTNVYAIIGILALLAVALAGRTDYGAKLGFQIGGSVFSRRNS